MLKQKGINLMSETEEYEFAVYWNETVKKTIELPHVELNREVFLRETLMPYCTEEQIGRAIVQRPEEVLEYEQFVKIREKCVKSYRASIEPLDSYFSDLPVDASVISTNISPLYLHVFVLIQKLLYLYGAPDLRSKGDNHHELAQIVTLFLGYIEIKGKKKDHFYDKYRNLCKVLFSFIVQVMQKDEVFDSEEFNKYVVQASNEIGLLIYVIICNEWKLKLKELVYCTPPLWQLKERTFFTRIPESLVACLNNYQAYIDKMNVRKLPINRFYV